MAEIIYFFQEEECGAKVQISTPKADHSRCTDRLSIVDRLSIIPKLDRSFVNDSEDFEVGLIV